MDNFFSANPPGVTEILKGKKVFVAGAGGLGSNVCVMLARAGIGHITVVDFDRVEASNLNRQQYFRDQIGKPKVTALKENLLRIDPELKINVIEAKLSADNCEELIPEKIDLIFECFDGAAAKAMLTGFALSARPDVPTIAVSGVAGLGPCEDITIRKGPGKLYIVGDGTSEMNAETGTIASRVSQVSAVQAHIGIRLLLGLTVS
ncbi:MAG: sulfur carrier protein ThiS adenylyltransferase ThiF [Victivallaceae bacterium]|nr:sulfur carrier protein ThiS adenylyltransferase ThiF [Victivallaceae bacterium]